MTLTNIYPSLKGKVVLITGGATGIGASMVSAFSQQGARVAFFDVQDEPAQALISQTSALPGSETPQYWHCDLLNIAELQASIEQVKHTLGPISILINNAASDTRHDFKSINEGEWDERIHVNLRHAFFAIQAVSKQMSASGGGSIVNFGSMSWHQCRGNMTGYTTAKAALEGMTRGLAKELGADNIRINTIVPGWVMTEKQLRERLCQETLADLQERQCLKHPLMPDNICSMALFLASDDSKMCTAQSFIVDGGWA